jgi:hypothetical protein
MAVSGGESDGEDRWIGNFGLGQRWFPAAKDEKDAGDWMIGYNAFFDYDFTRDHQRGGVGVEVQYDWLHLASNYYFPLSDWKGSKDFESLFVEERPAEGWDARVKAYLPFYRNVAFTGAYTQWYGDHVGMFGHRNLEKDPRVWSYGVEYTPIPLVSGFITQRSTEQGRTETEYGLNFTYHFNMPWDEQVSHSKVAEMRTVSGSRHEFVDRENRIILEYRTNSTISIIAENCGDFTSGNLYCTASLKARFMDAPGNPVSGATVTWSVISARNNSPAMMSDWRDKKTGLTWGDKPESGLTYVELQQERIGRANNNTSITASSGETAMQITDIVGERVITVQAKVNIGGTDYTATQAVSFGNGPLSVFRAPVGTSSPYPAWDDAYAECNGRRYPGTDYSSSSGWVDGNYVGGAYDSYGVTTDDPNSGKMPTIDEVQAVSSYYTGGTIYNPNSNAQGAAFAAGWPNLSYWTGYARTDNFAYHVLLSNGRPRSLLGPGTHWPVACLRR